MTALQHAPHAMRARRWPLFVAAAALMFTLFTPAALAPSGGVAGETLPARAAQPAPPGEIDRTGYVKGFYVSAAAMGNADFMARVHDLLETTELNAVVLDFKSDRGYMAFPTKVPLAKEIGADRAPTVQDPEEFLKWFKERDVYLIARIVTFKDNVLTKAIPAWAIVDTAHGGIWHDQEGMGWVDGNREGAWDYNVALAMEAADYGFDEVQFDYVRFPTDGNVGGALYSLPNTYDTRVAAISGILSRASAALRPRGVKVSADVFGYTAWAPDDLGIGQHLEVIAPYVDVLAPMIYPSTFASGLPGEDPKFRNAIAYPYEILNKSTERSLRRTKEINPNIEIRPWLQDFKDYAFDYRTYTPAEIRRQMDGAREGGGRGWLLWDPAVKYTKEALVSAQPAFVPNTVGQTPVLVYGEVAPEVLRDDLEWLLAQGYYPTTVRDLAQGQEHGAPAGKKAVVLTFDGSLPSHFTLLEGGTVDPASAAGVLLDFAALHPADFPPRATFFVRPDRNSNDSIFGTGDLASFKLQTLVGWGFEIGVMPQGGVALGDQTDEATQSLLFAAEAALAPLLPDYDVVSLALPDGQLPQNPLLLRGGGTAEQGYAFGAAVKPTGGMSKSPFLPDFDPYAIPRLPAGDPGGTTWRAAIQASEPFVSAGE
ncbi:MAG: hypothetical protein MUC34_01170 [Anaerolineae bacterium]|nr:hypothetical protein [Anaerolineae bacterium]